MIKNGFTVPELFTVVLVLMVIGVVSFFNFQDSQIKGRDATRKNDLRRISNGLEMYRKDFGVYPPERDGKILACGSAQEVAPCEWGNSQLVDLNDPSYPPYIDVIPKDPSAGRGFSYTYKSRGLEYLILAHLENKRDIEYKPELAAMNIDCGAARCNFALGSMENVVDFFREGEK